MTNPTGTLPPGLDESVVDVPAVEIFKVGDYGEKGTFSDADLAVMAATYAPDTHEAPVTLDHVQGGPAYGWAKRLFVEGGKLFADLIGVPAKMAEAIRRGRYKKRSVEIYRSFCGSGKPYIKAITFLGAAVPEVKGMRDITFAEGNGAATAIDFVMFGEPAVTDPDPGGHGVITNQSWTSQLLGHSHTAFLDADSNGFTSVPIKWEWDEREGYSRDIYETGGHQHIINAGAIEPAGDIPHTHILTTMRTKTTGDPTSMGEAPAEITPQEQAAMSAPPNTQETPVVDVAALQARADAAEAELKTLKATQFAEQQSARFATAYGDALKAGRVAPAEKEALKAIFDQLPTDGVVRFAEKDTTARDIFVNYLATRPAVVSMGEVVTEPQGIVREIDADAESLRDDVRIAKRADVIFAEAEKAGKPISYGDAVAQASKEAKDKSGA